MIRTLGVWSAAGDKARRCARSLSRGVHGRGARPPGSAPRPRVTSRVETIDDPAIGWVSELIEVRVLARDVFVHLRGAAGARERIVSSEAVIAARPGTVIWPRGVAARSAEPNRRGTAGLCCRPSPRAA